MSSPKNPFTTPQKAKNKYYPFTKKKLDLVPNKPPDVDSPYTRSGFANINKAIRDTNNSAVPNVLEGIVLMAPDEPIKYSVKSNNQNKENCSRNYYEGFCIWARTAIHQGILPDPVDILNGILSNSDKLTIELLRQEEIKYLDAVHAHGMLAPLNEGQKKPIIGEHVKVHYYNSIADSGEIIKGFYEIINNDNAAIELPSAEQQQAIKEIISEKEEEPIIAVTDNEVPKPTQQPNNPNNYKTSYPEFSFTEPPPQRDEVLIKDIVKFLSLNYSKETAVGTFATMWAESNKANSLSENGTFISPGGNNFGGVQTDSGRWSAPGIIGQYSRIDSGKKRRSFAIFQDYTTFLGFLTNRIISKNMNSLEPDQWTLNYINRWWSPVDKSQYTIETAVFNNKRSIFKTALRIYEKFSNTADS
jgi:hypothetical protein